MSTADRWLLPEGVEELLPGEATRAEALRRRLLDLFASWGYPLVMPPLLEFTESLLIGLGDDIGLQTFRVTDQLTGRMMGIRADITPQVARIDAHSMQVSGPNRLSYCGHVLNTKPKGLLASRMPIKAGAELYGEASIAADLEVISLMLETLRAAGVVEPTLDLGHVGVFQALLTCADLSEAQAQQLFDACQRKAVHEVDQLTFHVRDAEAAQALRLLVRSHGDDTVLAKVADSVGGWEPNVARAVADLQALISALRERYPTLNIYVDLAELRGFHYHTGLVFAAYAPGHGRALANGGRYDHIGEVFGRARAATGFSTDLKALLSIVAEEKNQSGAIFVAAEDGAAAWAAVCQLRNDGHTVVVGMPDEALPAHCDRRLIKHDANWSVVAA